MNKDSLYPPMPTQLPRKGNRFSRWLGRVLLRLLGWRVTGVFPEQTKLVVAVAPHTSNWDFITAMAGILAVGIRVHFLMKKEAFIWPFSKFFVWLGGVPIDRSASENTVDQIVRHFHNSEQLWMAIAPEGTRKKVETWKTGFLRVAQKAQVPVLLVVWDYSKKEFILDRIWEVGTDVYADCHAMKDYVRENFQARHPDKQ